MAPTTDLDGLVTEAAKILDKAATRFVEGHGAESAVRKKGNDFATEVDLAIEFQADEAVAPAAKPGQGRANSRGCRKPKWESY